MSNSPENKTFLKGLIAGIIGAIFFSGKAIIAKLMYRYPVDAIIVITFRMLFSLPFFALIGLWKAYQGPSLAYRDHLQIIILGLMGYYLSSFLDFLGLQYISAGLERLILFLTPSFVLIISILFLNKKITLREWGALFISYAGVILVFLNDALRGGTHILLGSSLVLASAISYAIYLIFSDRLLKRIGSIRLVAYAMCVSSFACMAQFLLLKPISSLTHQPTPVYILSLINAFFCTVLPVFLTMFAVSKIGAGAASQAGMIGPVSTLFLGAIILNEPITLIQLAGTALVISGIYLLSKKRV